MYVDGFSIEKRTPACAAKLITIVGLCVEKINSNVLKSSRLFLKNKNSILFIEFVVKSIVIPIVFIVLLNLLGVF